MNRIILMFLCITPLLTGCGQQLSGRYEGVSEIPNFGLSTGNSQVDKQMDDLRRQVQDAQRMTLEFDGSKVRMGTTFLVGEYKYQLKGKRLEIFAEASGQKAIFPMTLEDDGSITYATFRFTKVK